MFTFWIGCDSLGLCLLSLVEFHPDISLLQLFSSSADCVIRIWDLRTSKCLCVLESHFSAVTSLAFSPNGNTLVRYHQATSRYHLLTDTTRRPSFVMIPGKSNHSLSNF